MIASLITPEEISILARPCYVDEAKALRYIAEAESVKIKPVLGDDIYVRVKTDDNYIFRILIEGGFYEHRGKKFYLSGLKTALAYYAYSRLLESSSIDLTRQGAVNRNSDYSDDTTRQDRIDTSRETYAIADMYLQECITFLRSQNMIVSRRANSRRMRFWVIGNGEIPIRKSCSAPLPETTLGDVEIVQTTGNSLTAVMSQKAITDAINSVDKVLTFSGFVEDAEILPQMNPLPGGEIYYVIKQGRFAYLREGVYTVMWPDYHKYAILVTGKGIVPRKDVIYLHNNSMYLHDGEELISVVTQENEIPAFAGIVDSVDVTDSFGNSRQGEVWFINKPIVNGEIVDGGVFAYKVRDTYYLHWESESDYMTDGAPIEDRLFVYNYQQYIYKDGELNVISNNNTLKWKSFKEL